MSRKAAEPAKKEQNEYIPSFISKKPFYLESTESENDYLDHQRLQNSTPESSRWYDRGKRSGPVATKFRKGACENCGALTHKTKECLSRPRAKGAKWTGSNIEADEVVQEIELGWDAKRDRWNGYDATEYHRVIQEYEELENIKKDLRGESVSGMATNADGGDAMTIKQEEEARYAEESDMGRQQSTSTRNLRIREDTAKYLVNLDLESAKYDPKTRSMLDMGAQADSAAALVAEENFLRASGDAAEFERAQQYAWESQERNGHNKSHLQANPTSGEYFRKKDLEARDASRISFKDTVLAKYGGEEHMLKKDDSHIPVEENDNYVEYDNAGAIKDSIRMQTASKYVEDVLLNNHTSVWGSWWTRFTWGYACCHSIVKNSYCIGDVGLVADEPKDVQASSERRPSPGVPLSAASSPHDSERPDHNERSLNENLKASREDSRAHSKKRTVTEMTSGIDEEALDAYRRLRTVADDPMAKFLGRDELKSN